MASFISEVLNDIKSRDIEFSDVTFILPNRRAGIFLKHELTNSLDKSIFAPEILSIEEFVEELSHLKSAPNIQLLFEFYSIYNQLDFNNSTEGFDSFSKWAQILLQDFNEIDRYLIDPEKIFNYLSNIKDLEHWSLAKQQTDLVKNYLSFWKKLYGLYSLYTDNLKLKKIGYQGLMYREAVENLQNYIESNLTKQHFFIGFNALNTAEQTIIQELLQNDLASIYWDIDECFYKSPVHDAGLFARQYKKNWKYFSNNSFNWITDNYSKPKNIEIIGIPKNVGQAKYIGTLLNKLKKKYPDLSNTALVLGDETLLIPVINSFPESVSALNITMGFPLRTIPLGSLFESLLQLHKNKETGKIYNRDLQIILSHQFLQLLFTKDSINYLNIIIDDIQTNNLIFISVNRMVRLVPGESELLKLLFASWDNNPQTAVENCLELILRIKNRLTQNKKSNLLNLEYLFRFYEVFNQLKNLMETYKSVTDIKTLYSIYKELLNNENLDFKGEPLQGLQVMGMLESRVLDFETIIISSVNEGILPAGKKANSFIPFDVKIENELPTYKQKDAVYAYHFFRLIQRAKNVFILYNTEPDAFNGGEKSRFITQLEVEGIHDIKHTIVSPFVPPFKKTLNRIKKSESVMEKLKQVAEKGFSPSSLTSYIRNPVEFYYRKILNVPQFEDVEETVAYNTLGNVIHNTLEDFYKPFIKSYLTIQDLERLIPKINVAVTNKFKEFYKEGDIKSGKNLIIFEIAKRYVSNFINLEIESLKQGNKIKIIDIESNENKIQLDIPELDFPVYLTGKIDRIDEFNGVTRIIDYKTGKVDQGKMTVTEWDEINHDYEKFSKPYQILAYAYLIHKKSEFTSPIEAGVISFKNLNSGFLKFVKKESGEKKSEISQETLDSYFIQLKALILEICNPEIDFIEKEI